MKISRSRRLSRFVLIASLGLTALSPVAPASPFVDCVRVYVGCVDQASQLGSFWLRSRAGLDCAYEYVRCLLRLSGR